MSTVRLLVMGAAFLFALGCAQQQQPAQPEQPPFKPVANVEQLMESLVAHMAEDVWGAVGSIISEKGIEDIRPKNAEEWQEVQYAAMGLAETGNLLMFESRAKDKGEWIQFAQQLIDKSVEAAKAAEAKDPEQLLVVGGQIYDVCSGCHMKYIKDEPPPSAAP